MKTRYFLPAVLLLAACSDVSDWLAGDPAKDGCQQTHFACQDQSSVSLNYDDPTQRTVTLTLERNNDAAELTVPLLAEETTTKDEADTLGLGSLTLPAQAVFAAGSKTAEVQVVVPQDAPDGATYSYRLTLDTDEVDPYGKYENEGGSTFVGAISVISTPKTATARLQEYGVEMCGGDYAQKYRVTGDNTYLLTNFLNSGTDVAVTVDRTTGDVTLDEPNSYIYESYWYLCDKDGYYLWCYPNYKEGVMDHCINSFYVYTGDTDYTVWDEETQTLILATYVGFDQDYDNQNYDELCIYFGDVPARPGEKTWTGLGGFYYSYDGTEDGGVGGVFGDNGDLTVKCKVKDDGQTIIFPNLFDNDAATDLTVTIDPTTNYVTNITAGEVSDDYPEGDHMYADGGYYCPYDWAKSKYIYFYPNKGATEHYLNYIGFYEDGSGYCYWDPDDNSLWLSGYFYLDTDTSTAYWDCLYFEISEDGTSASVSRKHLAPGTKPHKTRKPAKPARQVVSRR